MSFQFFRQSTIPYNCTTFNLFHFISVGIPKGNLSFRETIFKVTKAKKIFQESEQFPSPATQLNHNNSKINAVEEKKLRNKTDAREEH